MLKPRQFGRFVLIDRISTGGMAEVYLAKSSGVQGFEKVVAIKRILPTVSEDPDFETMFIDEAKISAQLAHSNIGQIFEFGEVEGQYYIAMEYIPGKDLRAIQTHLEETDRVMDVPMALHVVSRLCQALDYAHRQKDVEGRSMEIIHRDISPPNVIVSFEGSIKLIDFGIAKATSRATRTRAGKLKGKFAYMSPEQVQGMALDHRSDVFSVGTLLHELLTNRRLFQGDSQLAVMQAVRRAEVDPPSTINPEVPLDVDKIVLKALSRDREQRYGWASELRADIERYFARSGSLFEIQQLARWMQAEFAGDILAERHLQERLHAVRPEAVSDDQGAADAEKAPAHVSIEPLHPGQARGELGVTDEADALAGLPMTDKQTALPAALQHDLEAETVRHALAAERGHPEQEAETVRHVLATERRAPDTDRRAPDTDRRAPDTDRRAPDTDRRALDTDRREVPDTDRRAEFQAVDGELVDSAEPDEMLASADQTPPDTSPMPMVIGPSGQKVRPELVNWPTEFGGEPSGEVAAPTPEIDEASLEAGPTQVEAVPPHLGGGPIAPGADRDRAVAGGALEVDSNPDRPLGRDAGDSDPAVEVGGIDGVLQTNEVVLRRQQIGRHGQISATQELSSSKVKSFTSAQVIIIAAGLTLVLAGLIATPLLVCNGSTSTTGGAVSGQGGTIVVTSKPAAGCSVSLDAKPKGLLAPGETLSLLRVPAGQHVVQLTCAGFLPYSTSVEVHRAEVTFVEAPLEPE